MCILFAYILVNWLHSWTEAIELHKISDGSQMVPGAVISPMIAAKPIAAPLLLWTGSLDLELLVLYMTIQKI